MMRKKTVQNLDGRYVTMVENAFYYCNPPEKQKVSNEFSCFAQQHTAFEFMIDLSGSRWNWTVSHRLHR